MPNCQFCKCEFKPKRFKLSTRQLFCSKQCRFDHHKAAKRSANDAKHDVLKLNCDHCNRQFQPRRRSDERFCSNTCKIEFHKAVMRRNSAALRLEIIVKCPVCDCEFSPDKTTKQRYCSRKCRECFPKKIYKALQRCREATDQGKLDHAHKVLGYTPRQLQERIQNHPNWEKVKDQEWHLDHIFPIVAFLHYGIRDLDKICCLENLQPLAGPKNCEKNDSYDMDLFQDWLFLKGWRK